MRVNIYGEEITNRVEIVNKSVNQRTFVGIRFYIKSPSELHHSLEDNDESAVTFWAPWTKKNGHDLQLLYEMMYDGCQAVIKLRAEKDKGIL